MLRDPFLAIRWRYLRSMLNVADNQQIFNLKEVLKVSVFFFMTHLMCYLAIFLFLVLIFTDVIISHNYGD